MHRQLTIKGKDAILYLAYCSIVWIGRKARINRSDRYLSAFCCSVGQLEIAEEKIRRCEEEAVALTL